MSWGRAALGTAWGGLATGALAVTLLAAGVAGLNLHLATPIGDALIGALMVMVPMALAWGGLALAAWMVRNVARLIGTHATRAERAVEILGAVSRRVAHPLVASTLVILAMFTVVPDVGPLAVYGSLAPFEIPVATGAVVGLLVGLGRQWRHADRGLGRAAALAALALATSLGVGVVAWAVRPGFGDAIVREPAAAVAAIPELNLPDPATLGPHAVVHATYGSGNVPRRPEFGDDADWLTPTVDASGALPDRDGVSAFFSRLLWGHDDTELPINGLVWYPAASDGPMPIALMVHGNHAAGEFSDPGYTYLGEHLASHGILAVSVDQNFLNGDAFFDYGGDEQGVRAWMLLRHLQQLKHWNEEQSHPLRGRLDLQRVAIIGHSRGGEAATVAAALEATDDELAGMPSVPRGFGIRTVVAIAPSVGQYDGPGAPVRLRDVDYLVLQGAHDGDLPAFSGLIAYHRATFTPGGDHLKVALYSQRANHGRFNTVWDTGDAGPLASWLLDRGSILSPEEQQRLAKGVINAFLQRSLFERTEYDAFFGEPRSGRAWLPDDVILTEWETSRRIALDDAGVQPRAESTFQGFDTATPADPGLRDGTIQGDPAWRLTWSGPAVMTVAVPPEVAEGLTPDDRLVFSMTSTREPLDADGLVVRLAHADGRERVLDADAGLVLRPMLPTRLWKVDAFGARYLPDEQLRYPAERFLQTYEIPVSAFVPQLTAVELDGIAAVVIGFSGAGSVYLDDIGFEPD